MTSRWQHRPRSDRPKPDQRVDDTPEMYEHTLDELVVGPICAPCARERHDQCDVMVSVGIDFPETREPCACPTCGGRR